ncbi:MAG: type II toxin-antitoxin system HicB family antitoxin [Desulfovibrio sp.]|nr:type II toxin-antitoxin system HicB family antitoxin [Desulfovibrio sp.]
MLNLVIEFLPPDPCEERNAWIVGCPEIDLYTQGDTYEEAAENSTDALQGWFKVCMEHGTREKVLAECGISPTRIASMKNSYTEALVRQPLLILAKQGVRSYATHKTYVMERFGEGHHGFRLRLGTPNG